MKYLRSVYTYSLWSHSISASYLAAPERATAHLGALEFPLEFELSFTVNHCISWNTVSLKRRSIQAH